MKKALQISIAKTLFTIEEDAYALLDGYIASVKDHFAYAEGKDEIIADIESRIAEQLVDSKEQVISIGTVEKITSVMGKVEDFDDKENVKDSEASSEHVSHHGSHAHHAHNAHGYASDMDGHAPKKLYRNPDNQYIGGVASGIAEYFKIDPMWPRLAFVAIALLNGIGILLYIILWIVLPEAKTKAQKLEMKGAPVTLDTLSKKVNEKMRDIDASGRLRRIVAFPFKLIGRILRAIMGAIGPIFRIGTGIFLTLAGIGALIGTVIFAGFMISDSVLIMYDTTLSSLLPGGLHWIVIIGFALAIIIPAVFVLISGVSLLQKRSIFTRTLSLGFLGIWLLALAASGFGAAKIVGNYESIEATSPAYQEVKSEISIDGPFTKLSVIRGAKLTVVQGTSTSLVATGRPLEIETVRATVQDGVLTIDRKRTEEPDRICLFCWTENPELVLTTPLILEASTANGADLLSDHFPAGDSLSLLAEHGSYMNIKADTKVIAATSTNGSQIELEGKADAASIYAANGSRIYAEDFAVQNATTTAMHGSVVRITVGTSLNASSQNGSNIRYSGNPIVIKEMKHGGMVESADEY